MAVRGWRSLSPFACKGDGMTNIRKWLLLKVGFLVGVFCLALRGLDLREVDRPAGGLLVTVPGVAICFVAVWARTWRWHYLLRPIKRVRWARCSPSS